MNSVLFLQRQDNLHLPEGIPTYYVLSGQVRMQCDIVSAEDIPKGTFQEIVNVCVAHRPELSLRLFWLVGSVDVRTGNHLISCAAYLEPTIAFGLERIHEVFPGCQNVAR